MGAKYRGTIFDREIPPRIDNPRWKEFERAFAPDPVGLDRHIRFAEALIRDLKLGAGSKVLEVGSGVGLNALEIASRGIKVYDLDIVPSNVELVNYLARQMGLDVTAIYGDSCYLPFADGQFDAVFSKCVFEHIHDQETALDEQIRVLKTGGRFLTLDGNLIDPFTLIDLIFTRPKQSKGTQGGLGWLFRKGKARSDYGTGWLGKDEDCKTVWWWKRRLCERRRVTPIKVTTTRNYFYPDKLIYKILKPIAGGIIVVFEKAA